MMHPASNTLAACLRPHLAAAGSDGAGHGDPAAGHWTKQRRGHIPCRIRRARRCQTAEVLQKQVVLIMGCKTLAAFLGKAQKE